MLLKGQCNKIVDNFIWLNRFDVCLILTDKNGFANFFVFAKIFGRNFSIATAVFIFLNYCYWMCKHTQIPFFA